MRRSLLCLALVVVAPPAVAQAAPPSAPDAAPSKAAPDSDSLDDDDAPPKRAAASELGSELPRGEGPKPLPPPADPRADEQEPRPLLPASGERGPERHVEIGPDFGLWSRPSKGDGEAYSPGLAYGVHARVELSRFLGFRAYFSQSTHEVTPDSELVTGMQVEQPDLQVFQLGARAEPTFMPTSTLRLWAGVGVAWARATAPEPSSSAQLRYADRSGVMLEYSAALGATWDAIPNWLATTLSFSGGLVTSQSGDLFQDHQVSDGTGGSARIDGLPKFASSFAAHLGVGIIL